MPGARLSACSPGKRVHQQARFPALAEQRCNNCNPMPRFASRTSPFRERLALVPVALAQPRHHRRLSGLCYPLGDRVCTQGETAPSVLAWWIMPSERSTPVTLPLGPTARAAGSVTRPVPQPTSSTRSPGCSAASSTTRAA